ncbi:nucleotidyltransferase domain-containing protein [Desulfococcaceae bacterium HSG8]|nr:nucleotidyltransferase domain-containing protein [Desulfococcaceae bacterium HSG8]
MDKIPVEISEIINEFIHKLEQNNVHIQQAVLFGSYSKGLEHEWSDIDIVLVSDAFEGVRFEDRKKIGDITLSVSTDLSPLPFRPEDFTPEDPFVKEILSTGVRIV